MRGINLMGLGRMDEARNAMQRATVLDPSYVGAMHDLSLLETNAGRMDQALYWSKRAFVHAPNVATSFYQVSLPLSWLDNDAAARWAEAGARRFQLSTGDALRLQYVLAVTEWRSGRPDAALDRLRPIVKTRPKNTEAQLAFADLAVIAGAPEAAEHLDRTIGAGFGDAYGFYSPYSPRTGRAFVYMQAGNRAAAQPLIDAVLTSNRDAIQAGDRGFPTRMQNAALLLMRGDRAGALDALEAGVRAGWKDAMFLEHDPLLAGLKSEPRFQEIKRRIEQEVSEMRARADFRNLNEWAGVAVVGQ
jgi:tetratricopeptide (TPR) repeat protein